MFPISMLNSPIGVNTVTTLVESKKAQLVVIAHDVDPIEVRQLNFVGLFLAVWVSFRRLLILVGICGHLQ